MQPDQPQPHQGSKISNTEWGLVIGAAVLLDAVEFGLDIFGIGLVLNELIDVGVGMALPYYFHLRGVKKDKRKITTWVLATLFEMFTDGLVPIGWTIDVLATMYWDKRDKKLSKLPI